jgi:predicted RNA-binding protein with PUA-like domain
MKSEPDEFSIMALEQKKTHYWDGVRNYEARNFMRDKMQVDNLVIFYHSNANPSGPAGIAKIASTPYPDFTQWDKNNKHYDKKASEEKPIWYMVDVSFVKRFPRTISREELKAVLELTDMQLWKRNRLSITPLSKKEFETIVQLGSQVQQKNMSKE